MALGIGDLTDDFDDQAFKRGALVWHIHWWRMIPFDLVFLINCRYFSRILGAVTVSTSVHPCF